MVYEGSEQLKILLVVEPGIDGVFRYVEGLAKFLIAKGHEVHLAYSDKRGSPDLIELVRYVDSKGFECLNLRVSNAPHISDVRALYGLRRLASRARPNVIHCHSSKAGVLGRTLALLGVRSRYFYTPHAYYGLSGTTDKRTTLYNHIEKFFGKIGTTINISNDERRFAIDKLRLRPDRTVLINNPVDSSRFVPSTPEIKRQIRESFGVPNDALVLGSMGRLSSQKDPQTLYEAFNLARQKIPEIYLLHVGQGELTREMDDLANQLQIRDRLIRLQNFTRPSTRSS
jgi:glycosyltransferase involved in cell wall biosynthesis